MKLRLDFSNVSDGFEPLPPGDYLVRMDDTLTRYEKAKTSENMKLMVTYIVEQPTAHRGRRIFDQFAITPNSLWKLKRLCRACGVDVPAAWFDLDTETLHGKPFVARITVDESGERNEVKDYRKAQVNIDGTPMLATAPTATAQIQNIPF